MRIGQVSLSYRPIFGGQDTYIENLNSVLRGMGHEPTVYQSLSMRHEIDHDGVVALRALPFVGRVIPNFTWYYFNFGLRFLKKKLLSEDLLISHYAVHYPPIKKHKRLIVLSHGIEWHEPPRLWDDKLRARRAIETFKKCFVVANDTEYLRYCGVAIKPGEKAFSEVAPGKWYIPNCVDVARFANAVPSPKLSGKKVILVPRNIYYSRGVHLAIEAFAEMRKHQKFLDHELWIVGNVVDQKYFSELEASIKKLGLRQKVVFTGHAKWTEMASLYAGSQCTLIPTVECEGTSLSALESMACGTPVVSTNVAGLKDLPTEQAAAEAQALALALEKVLSDREAIAHKQRKAVEAGFNIDLWQEAWRKVIGKVMQ